MADDGQRNRSQHPGRRLICVLLLATGPGRAAGFGNESAYESTWADTPHGRFVCRDDRSTDYRQVLTLEGRVLYREESAPDGIVESDDLSHGITHEGTGCPEILANERGYVVLVRDLQPTPYGVLGYALIDFNRTEPRLVPMGVAQRAEDERVAPTNRLRWSDQGLGIEFVGYEDVEDCCRQDSPRPKRRVRFYDFASGETRDRR